jgi:hydrogenase nickel incorporation protein HypA/HybF
LHESSLIPDLMEKIDGAAREHGAQRITVVDLTIGALAFIEPDHLRDHFVVAAEGTKAEGAQLRIRVDDDVAAPDAHAIRLDSIELET